jgi:hypothetical protein
MKTEGEARTQEKNPGIGQAKSCAGLPYSLEEVPVVQYAPEVIICASAGLKDISIVKAVQLKACGKPGKLTAIENCD